MVMDTRVKRKVFVGVVVALRRENEVLYHTS